MSKATVALAELLGVSPARLGVLSSYGDDEVEVLTAAIRIRMAAESAAVDAGFNDALRFVPWPLRGPARKVLFPGERDE